MPKSDFNLAGYALVSERITEFYERFNGGRIITHLISRDETIVFKAEVYRKADDSMPAATGWASEREGDGEINIVACLENTETSAIGRALANLGFTASRQRPSYEEMQKADRARVRFQRAATRSHEAGNANVRRVSESKAVGDPGNEAARTTNGEKNDPSPAEKIGSLTVDVLALVQEARQKKIPEHLLTQFDQRIGTGFLTVDQLVRIERQLRHWILNGYEPPSDDRDASSSRKSVNTPHQ